MTVTVAVPYWDCADSIERCVRSILAQSHKDIQVIVIGDGQSPVLPAFHDDRLEIYVLPENRGVYFCHELALRANPHMWHAMVDADDWVEPHHLHSLIKLRRPAVASGRLWRHEEREGFNPRRNPVWGSTPLGSHCGLFKVSRLREIGGYNPVGRMAQDTLVLKLLAITGGYARSRTPTYHRVKRHGSLTTSPTTGLKTPARQQAYEEITRTFDACKALLPNLEAIKEYRLSLIPAEVSDALDFHVERLSALLGTPAVELAG